MWEAGSLRDTCVNVSSGREGVFDLSDEYTVGEKGFDNFNDFRWNVELWEFVKEAFVSDSIEGFFHIEEDGCGVYVVVEVLAELVGEFGQ